MYMDFKEHLKSYLDDVEINELLHSLDNKPTHALLLNTNKISKMQFVKMFPNIKQHPIVENGFIYDENEYEFGKHIFHEMGVYYLQEPSAMCVSYLLDIDEGDKILDLCAAPGGKTVQASLKLKNTGCIIANDISKPRCDTLLQNIERMGISNVLISNNDFQIIYKSYLNYFDKIILDAPCSGSGMFRKNEDIKNDWSYNKVLKFAEIQKQLIVMAFQMLKPGGELIYSTCSFSKEENEDVIDYLLNYFENASLLPFKETKFFYKCRTNPIGVHLFPFKFEGEGHYICKIKKDGGCNGIEKEQFGKSIKQFGDFVFSLPFNIKCDKLHIVRYGLKHGEYKNKNFIPSYHLSHSYDDFLNNYMCYELNDELFEKYIRGESIRINIEKGWILLTFKNIPLCFSKSDGMILKNHFPKYLRNKHFIK